MTTLKNKIKNIVKESVRQVIAEKQQAYMLKNIIKEEVKKHLFNNLLKEADEESGSKQDTKRNSVMSALKNDILNHAPLAYKLYPSSDETEKATARSLFSKKATGTPDADGQIRHFSDEEINKIYNLIRTSR